MKNGTVWVMMIEKSLCILDFQSCVNFPPDFAY